MLKAVVFIIAPNWKQPRSLSKKKKKDGKIESGLFIQ